MSQQPGTSSSFAGGSRPAPSDVKEFNFRFPQNQKKRYSVMQFKRNDNVDLSKWQQARMERENNKVHFKTDLDDLPKFGAGSEFGRERREEARQKKYGIIAQRYKEEDQPWILKQGGGDGKAVKKYRGRKEGSINENSSYFILSQLADGTFEAYPVDSWYNFTAMQTYRTLNAEEAEEEFGRRDKTMNFFSVMVQKKLRDNKDDEEKEEGPAKSRGSDLTLMEDDYFLSDEDEMEDSDDEFGDKGKSKPKGGKAKGKGKKTEKKKRPKKKDLDSEAEEESDEGDFDGREFDYISEQSSDDDDVEIAKTDIKGLDQELQQMEDEEEEEEAEEEEGKEKEKKEGEKIEDSKKESKEKKSDESSSESSGSDSDIDEKNIQSAMLLQKKNTKKSGEKSTSKTGSGSQSRSQTPTVPETVVVTDSTLTDAAKKLESKDQATKKRTSPTDSPAQKRPRTESPVPGVSSKTPAGRVPLTEDEVRRYLMRRPMTTKDLLVKLNPRRTGLPKEQIETKLAEILVKLAPEKRKKDNKIYWFIREHSK